MALTDGLPNFWQPPLIGKRAVELTRFIDGFELTEVPLTFISPIEAYDYAVDTLSVDVHFDPDVFEGWATIRPELKLVTVPLDAPAGAVRAIIPANTMAQDRDDALEAYQDFLAVRETYLAEPTHFYNAYQFVRQHPYFWNTWGSRQHRDEILGWEYELQPDDLHLNIFRDDEEHGNVIVFLLESGPYTGANGSRHEHTLDMRLTSSGPNYEQALLNFAAMLEALVDETGSERIAG